MPEGDPVYDGRLLVRLKHLPCFHFYPNADEGNIFGERGGRRRPRGDAASKIPFDPLYLQISGDTVPGHPRELAA